MVPFAGYALPVQYGGPNGGVKNEHLWCRSLGKASLFDVSHMGQVRVVVAVIPWTHANTTKRKLIAIPPFFGSPPTHPPTFWMQIRWHGNDRAAFLETLVVGDIAGLAENHGLLSLVTNEKGGILDDTVITNAGDHIYMVVNGATKFGDMEHFEQQLATFQGDVTMEYLEDEYQLLALQGPGAAEVVQQLLPSTFDLTRMPFMTGTSTTLDGVEHCRITRYVCCGWEHGGTRQGPKA